MDTDRTHALTRLQGDWQTRDSSTSGVRYHQAAFGRDLRFGNGPEVDGVFTGYGSIFGVTDSYGTRMMPGCWRAGGLDEQPYALLWMHNPDVVLGTFTAREDERGLWMEGRYDATDVGQRARAQAQSGSAPELSVGFVQLESLADDADAFTVCRLVEVSQITARMASTPGAALANVRAAADVLLAPPVTDLIVPDDRARAHRIAAALRLT
jgi:HK97 family phage prohead protease